MCLGDPMLPRAREWADRAIELDRMNGMQLLLGRDYHLSARVWKRMGDPNRARDDLTRAAEIFRQCGADGYFKKAGQELALFG